MLKAAVLGMGFMGQTHCRNLMNIKDVKVTALCEADRGKVKNYEQDGIPVYSDFDRMLEKEEPDIIVICLPPFAHNGEFEKAAKKGISVFIEKPVALKNQDAERLVRAAKEYGIITQVGYHQRFGEAVKRLRQIIDSGEAGRPCLFQGLYSCNALHAPWWREKEKCGGQVLEQVIHTYDMALYLMGEVTDAFGAVGNVCHRDVERYNIEDVSVSCLRFSNGALGSICATNCGVPMRWDNPFKVVFEKLTADFSDPNHARLYFTQKGYEEVIDEGTDLYMEEMGSFVQAVKEGKQPECGIEAGYESLKLVNRVLESSGGI